MQNGNFECLLVSRKSFIAYTNRMQKSQEPISLNNGMGNGVKIS